MFYSSASRPFRALNHAAFSVINNRRPTFSLLRVPRVSTINETRSVSKMDHYRFQGPVPQVTKKPEYTYAEALLAAASKSNNLKRVLFDMNTIQSTLEKDPKLRLLFSDPILSRKIEIQDMESILSRLLLCAQVRNLLKILVENRRLPALESIILSFKSLLASRDQKEVICKITTAEALDDSIRMKIEGLVQKVYEKKKRPVRFFHYVEPKILGGIIIKLDNEYMIDISIQKRIRDFTQIISKVV